MKVLKYKGEGRRAELINSVKVLKKNVKDKCWCRGSSSFEVNIICYNGNDRDYYFCEEHVRDLVVRLKRQVS